MGIRDGTFGDFLSVYSGVGVYLIKYQDDFFLRDCQVMKDFFYDVYFSKEIRVGCVDDVKDDVSAYGLKKRRRECLDELRRKIFDKSDGVGYDHGFAQFLNINFSYRAIKGRKQRVFYEVFFMGERVK